MASIPEMALLRARTEDPLQHRAPPSSGQPSQWTAHQISHKAVDPSFHGKVAHKLTSADWSPHVHGNQAIYTEVDVAKMR